jgi:hypothetical protein
MTREDMRELLKRAPFLPIRCCLTDGRCLIIRHPDQAVVTNRRLIVGLARVGRSQPLTTPASVDEFAPDWLMVDLLHIVSAEPVEEAA